MMRRRKATRQRSAIEVRAPLIRGAGEELLTSDFYLPSVCTWAQDERPPDFHMPFMPESSFDRSGYALSNANRR
jgi:hypothetical protein